MSTIEDAFNKYAVKGRIDQSGFQKLLKDFDVNNNGFDIADVKALAAQDVDLSRAVMNSDVKQDLDRGCKLAKKRNMDTGDIVRPKNYTYVTQAVFLEAARQLGIQKGIKNPLVLTMSLPELKSYFRHNASSSLLTNYPGSDMRCPARVYSVNSTK